MHDDKQHIALVQQNNKKKEESFAQQNTKLRCASKIHNRKSNIQRITSEKHRLQSQIVMKIKTKNIKENSLCTHTPFENKHQHMNAPNEQEYEGMNLKKERTHTHTPSLHWSDATRSSFRRLLVHLMNSLERSKGLSMCSIFSFALFFLSAFCWRRRNGLWWLLRVIRNGPTVSQAHFKKGKRGIE